MLNEIQYGNIKKYNINDKYENSMNRTKGK